MRIPCFLLAALIADAGTAQAKVAPPDRATLARTLAAIQKDPLRRSDPSAYLAKLQRKLGEFEPGPGHYAVLLSTAETAETLGEMSQLLATLDRIATTYDVPPIRVYRKPFERLLKRLKSKAPHAGEIAKRCIVLFDTSLAGRKLDDAAAFYETQNRAAKKSSVAWLKKAARYSGVLLAAFRKVANKPDANAYRTAASFYLNRDDWPAACELLAKLGEGELDIACKKEFAKPTGNQAYSQLADAWRSAARNKKLAMFRQRFLNRAMHWLRKARDGATEDVQRIEIDRTLESLRKDRHAKRAKRNYLAKLREDLAIIGYDRLIKGKELARGDMRFAAQPIENGLFTHPTHNLVPTRVGYTIKGRYESVHGTVALADSGAPFPSQAEFELYGDGRRIWRSPRVDRSHIGRAFDMHMDIGRIHWLELRVRIHGSARSAHTVWLAPYVTSG